MTPVQQSACPSSRRNSDGRRCSLQFSWIERTRLNHPILAFEAALVEAQLAGDVDALDRLLDDDLYFAGLEGKAFSKADDLAAHRSGHLRITRMLPKDRHITALGSVVVVSVLMDAEAVVAGASQAAMLRYTRVWRERPDGWKVIAGHMSVVP
jgi:ketosteroid isomerase-like protein